MRSTTQHDSLLSSSGADMERLNKHAVLSFKVPIGAWVRSLSLVFPLLFWGCTSIYYVRPGTLEPDRAQVAPEERAAIWKRAVGVLLDQGYVPQVMNESASFISAKRRDDFVNDSLSGTLALVYISPDGGVRVEVAGSGIFHSEQQFLSAVGERQRLLLKLILNRSGDASTHH
jgi:hypothetical protein